MAETQIGLYWNWRTGSRNHKFQMSGLALVHWPTHPKNRSKQLTIETGTNKAKDSSFRQVAEIFTVYSYPFREQISRHQGRLLMLKHASNPRMPPCS